MMHPARQAIAFSTCALGAMCGGCMEEPTDQARATYHFHGCDVRVYSEGLTSNTLDIVYEVEEASPNDVVLTLRSATDDTFTLELGKRTVVGFEMKELSLTDTNKLVIKLEGFGSDYITVNEDPETWAATTLNAAGGDVSADQVPDVRVIATGETSAKLHVDFMGKSIELDMDMAHMSN